MYECGEQNTIPRTSFNTHGLLVYACIELSVYLGSKPAEIPESVHQNTAEQRGALQESSLGRLRTVLDDCRRRRSAVGAARIAPTQAVAPQRAGAHSGCFGEVRSAPESLGAPGRHQQPRATNDGSCATCWRSMTSSHSQQPTSHTRACKGAARAHFRPHHIESRSFGQHHIESRSFVPMALHRGLLRSFRPSGMSIGWPNMG